MIRIKRVYELAKGTDGYRILVDRLWPRGLSKDKAQVDLWLKEISPCTPLRKWYRHDPERWPDFKRRYQRELSTKMELIRRIKRLEKEHPRVTLLFATREVKRNNAVALLEVLRAHRSGRSQD
jgi:uncharacterized protein YeaO (DUF488 family)